MICIVSSAIKPSRQTRRESIIQSLFTSLSLSLLQVLAEMALLQCCKVRDRFDCVLGISKLQQSRPITLRCGLKLVFHL